MEGKRKTWRLDDRAISPEIGAILMVAILVILGVVIGVFVLDLGQNVEQSPEVGLTFDDDPNSGDVTVQVNSVQRADKITIDGTDCGAANDITISNLRAGASETVSCSQNGEIVVTATFKGNTEVVQKYQYDDN